ncbi:uncharacterized protein LOC129589308 [Paramacrobiotus metropolitanus]|uniref:uncharacterized protein LOC129589308 n=1 Tax=Paramacrobiotus metropolitanus TaxID=2943436 RepID=UPI002445DDD4|nr:uncharacterized protein LOC129589308 [Paramacrobiotus metropolitanus]
MAFLSILWINNYAPQRQAELRYITAFTHLASSFWIFVAYTIFAANAYVPQWLPGWQNNYLSWSFGICVVSGLQMFTSSALFFWDGVNVQKRTEKRKRANGTSGGISHNHTPLSEELELCSDQQNILLESDV